MAAATAATTRVALISSSYAPYVGGVEQHVRRVAYELASQGLGVEVWTVDRGEHLGTRDIDGVVVRYLPSPLPARNVKAMLSFLARMPPAWRSWRRAFGEFRPQLLHIHCFGPNGVYARALHRRTGTPLAVTSHGETFMDDHGIYRRSALLRRELTDAVREAVFVTAPTEFTLSDLRASYGLRAGHVIPNGVDLDIGAIPPTSAPETPYVAAVGRLGRTKGFDLLIEAFAQAGLPNECRLVIGGGGPEREALARLISEEGLHDRVELLGELSPEQVDWVMRHALAVVVPSRVEAFGIVALEAWRAGTALIMTDRGGAPEFVRHDVDGLLVDTTDIESLAAAMRRVAEDAELRNRLAEAGRERVSQFTWPRVAAEYRRLYGEALRTSPHAPEEVDAS